MTTEPFARKVNLEIMEFSRIMPVHLDEAQIEGIIPHRKPFRFVDEIIEVEYGKRAVGMLNDLTKPEYDWVRSHFPSHHLVPGAIILEALAEVGAVAVLGLPENRNKIAMLVGADRVRWRIEVKPGDIVRLETEITNLHSRFGRGYSRAILNDNSVATDGLITFYITDKPTS